LKLRKKLDLFLVGIFQFLSSLNHLLFSIYIDEGKSRYQWKKQIPAVACPTSDKQIGLLPSFMYFILQLLTIK